MLDRILLGKSSNRGIVISGAEVVGLRFPVEVLAAVAEGVGIAAGVLLIAEGVVGITLGYGAAVAMVGGGRAPAALRLVKRCHSFSSAYSGRCHRQWFRIQCLASVDVLHTKPDLHVTTPNGICKPCYCLLSVDFPKK